MCGISGLVMRDGSAVSAVTIERMATTLKHRGPDDSGIFVDGNVGLGHRRLSIIDLSPGGHQPLLSEDGEYVIVFNGEVYNYQELRDELIARGFMFRSRSDTEVVLKAFMAWGRDAFLKLNGMFAFAIWDRRRRALVLVRDRFGIKPLFYSIDDNQLAFGSEVKALRAVPGSVGDSIAPQSLVEYMYYGNSLGPNTLIEGVRRLEPGHWLELASNRVATGRYWSPSQTAQISESASVAANEVRRRLEAAVHRQMISDVPLGVFLSGGVDSTAVVAAATSLEGSQIDTFTARFDFSADTADVVMARRVAKHFNTNHHELDVSGYQLEDVLGALIDAHDFPFGDAANVPLFLLTRALNGNPKVILQGDGGDELFAGYRRYALLSVVHLLGPAVRYGRPLLRMMPHSQLRARLDRMAWALGAADPADRMARLLTEEKPDRSPLAVLSGEWRDHVAKCDAFSRYREIAKTVTALGPVQGMLFTDCQILLPDIFLEKVDRPTMANGIEVRVPLLDHALADYVLSLPAEFKVRRGRSKWIFKRALEGLVPDFVLRRPKAGFGVPYGEWLRGPLRSMLQEQLLDASTDRFQFFDRGALKQRVDEHLSRLRDHSFLLWKALQLSLWQSHLGTI